MKRICVFSGSNPGVRPEYEEGARELGREMVQRGYELVYGGGSLGLMGRVANQVMDDGGKVVGIMPRGLFRSEVEHKAITEFREVGSMHERKAMMNDLSDGFIAMPGGLGTFEELFEVACWAQIGIHHKPIGVLNVAGFYDPMITMLKHAVEEGFVKATNLELLIVESDPATLLSRMETYEPVVQQNKWSELEPKSDSI